MNLTFLSCPYTHQDQNIKKVRHHIANTVACELTKQGVLVFSPLTHNIPIDQIGFKGTCDSWKDFNHTILSKCNRLIVLKLPGWDESKGVAADIAKAKSLNLPIEWMESSHELSESNPKTNDLLKKMFDLYTERDWNKFHSPKNLAINLGVEVGELMEHFRWITEAQSYTPATKDLAKIKDEIGDVYQMLVYLAHTLGIDPITAAHEKLDKMAIKYPVEKCKGRCEKYTEYE